MNNSITQLFYQDLLTLSTADLRILFKHLKLSKGSKRFLGKSAQKKDLAAAIAKYQSTILRKKARLKSAEQLNAELINAIQMRDLAAIKQAVAEGADPLNQHIQNIAANSDSKAVRDYLITFTQPCQNEYDLVGNTIADSKIDGKVIVYNVPGTNNNYCFTLEDLYGLVSSSNPVNPYTGERFSEAFIDLIKTEIVHSEAYSQTVKQMEAEQAVATSKISNDLVVLNRVMDAYPYLDITGIQNGREDPNLLKVMRTALQAYSDISDEATYDQIMTALGVLESNQIFEDWGFKVTQYLLEGPPVLLEILTDELADPIATLMVASAIPTDVLMSSLIKLFDHGVRSFPTVPPSFVSTEYITTLMNHLRQLRDEEDIRTDLDTLDSLIQNRNWTEAQNILKSIFEKLINDHETEIRGDVLNVLKNFFIQWDATDPVIFSELFNLANYQNADQIAETIDNIRGERYNLHMWYEDENGVLRRNSTNPADNQALLARELLEKLQLGSPIRELMEYSRIPTNQLLVTLQALLLQHLEHHRDDASVQLAKIDNNLLAEKLRGDSEIYEYVQKYGVAIENKNWSDAINNLKNIIGILTSKLEINDTTNVLYYLADALLNWDADTETGTLQQLINSMTPLDIAITLDNMANHKRDEIMWYTDAQGTPHRRATADDVAPAEYPVTPRLSISDSYSESDEDEEMPAPSNVQRRLF